MLSKLAVEVRVDGEDETDTEHVQLYTKDLYIVVEVRTDVSSPLLSYCESGLPASHVKEASDE